jgi:hypothetical protein
MGYIDLSHSEAVSVWRLIHIYNHSTKSFLQFLGRFFTIQRQCHQKSVLDWNIVMKKMVKQLDAKWFQNFLLLQCNDSVFQS